MASKSPKKSRRTIKTVRFQEESDSKSEDDHPPTPPPAKKKRRHGKYNKKNTKTSEVGRQWQPGMYPNDSWEMANKKAFWKAKKEYCVANPV